MDSNGNNSCKFGSDLLAYLYNETPAGDRELFEMHLAECGACTDEFAELSLARYSVYEWQKLEFAPMKTPEIVIPFETKAVSWFDKVRAAFAFSNNWATAGVALAVLTLAVIGGVVVVNQNGGKDVAGVKEVVTPSPEKTAVATNANQNITLPQPDEVAVAPEPSRKSGGVEKSEPVPVSIKMVPKNAPNSRPTGGSNRNRNVPRLNGLDEEDEDKSLRLTDILDDLDTLE